MRVFCPHGVFICTISLELLLASQVLEPVLVELQELVQELAREPVQEPLALLPFCSQLQR
jgi:hypothetical protein